MPQRTRLHTCRNAHFPHCIITVHCLSSPLSSESLEAKFDFRLHNAISPALNCQDNLYQSGGESPEWSSSYFSGRQEQTRMGGGGGTISTPAKPRTPRWHQRGVDARLQGGKTDGESWLTAPSKSGLLPPRRVIQWPILTFLLLWLWTWSRVEL